MREGGAIAMRKGKAIAPHILTLSLPEYHPLRNK